VIGEMKVLQKARNRSFKLLMQPCKKTALDNGEVINQAI